MPEGPTIQLLKEKLESFKGEKIVAAEGYAKGIDTVILKNQTVTDIKSWGKQLIICFPDFAIRLHMGLFGSYKINDRSKSNASLHLKFKEGEINFYITSVKLIEEPLDEVYDWAADVLNPAFDPKKARERLLKNPQTMICDALLNQDIFAGSGNIVKNEVLFRVKVHPENIIGNIPTRKLNELIKETVKFCADFYNWKKENKLIRHLEAYEKEMCPRNHIPFHKADLGKTKRHTYFCPVCQVLYK